MLIHSACRWYIPLHICVSVERLLQSHKDGGALEQFRTKTFIRLIRPITFGKSRRTLQLNHFIPSCTHVLWAPDGIQSSLHYISLAHSFPVTILDRSTAEGQKTQWTRYHESLYGHLMYKSEATCSLFPLNRKPFFPCADKWRLFNPDSTFS